MKQRGLPRAVHPHDDVGLAGVHREIHAVEEFLVPRRDVQIFDTKQFAHYVTSKRVLHK